MSLTTTHHYDAIVIGSGAAGLAAAIALHRRGVTNIAVITEGLFAGTSINTGSDKQTYYKLSLCGDDSDSPREMAESYFQGGAMHGEMALVEASLSARAFLNLVEAGIPFPQDPYGQFVGYKTDHDPRRRATSIGPYTSREMCKALIRQVEQLDIKVLEKRTVVELLTRKKSVFGAVAIDELSGTWEVFLANSVVFATGGPGGLYKTSVYPLCHTGGIGLALRKGVVAQNLSESQFGLASTKFRWNVSGTFMQAIPRFISTDQDGKSNPCEFLREAFDEVAALGSHVFRKGYEWPFDTRKLPDGSSLIDLLVYRQTEQKGRRVFLDYRENPEGLDLNALDDEARDYLVKSDALFGTPIERLQKMNPAAIALYAKNGIDITREPLEIALCAQHNNGGLASDHWFQSISHEGLFPIGEVNGSHGVARPGGSALNSGQVAALRAADYIAAKRTGAALNEAPNETPPELNETLEQLGTFAMRCTTSATRTWREVRNELQERMSRAGAAIREKGLLTEELAAAVALYQQVEQNGLAAEEAELYEAFRTRDLAFSHVAYLSAILFVANEGVGSRGSGLVLDPQGQSIHPLLGQEWKMLPEEPSYREEVQETFLAEDASIQNRWIKRRPIPESDLWFETAWAKFQRGEHLQ